MDDGAVDQTNSTPAGALVADRGHKGEYSTLLYANEAVRILHEHKSRTQPLYIYLAFQAVHGPYQAPERYMSMYANVTHYDSRAYLAMITAMDDAVNMVVRAAKHTHLWENSLLLFCSDNGARLGDATGSNHPFRGGKFTLWEGGTRILAFVSGPLVAARRPASPGGAGTWNGLAHTCDFLPTLLKAAGISTPQRSGPTPLDGVDLWDAMMTSGESPRREVLHNILNRWNHRDCRGSDLDEENCGAAIRMGKYKLLTGYPGDSRWSNHSTARPGRRTLPRGPQMPWDFKGLGTNAWHAPRKDGCNLFTGVGCPCWRGNCLFDVEADPGERVDLSSRLPHVVKQLLTRLTEASTTGTQGAHLCHTHAEADKRALAKVLKAKRAFLPFANASSAVWHDDRGARSCYNPCPLRVEHERLETGVQSGLPPAWCTTLDAAQPPAVSFG